MEKSGESRSQLVPLYTTYCYSLLNAPHRAAFILLPALMSHLYTEVEARMTKKVTNVLHFAFIDTQTFPPQQSTKTF